MFSLFEFFKTILGFNHTTCNKCGRQVLNEQIYHVRSLTGELVPLCEDCWQETFQPWSQP